MVKVEGRTVNLTATTLTPRPHFGIALLDLQLDWRTFNSTSHTWLFNIIFQFILFNRRKLCSIEYARVRIAVAIVSHNRYCHFVHWKYQYARIGSSFSNGCQSQCTEFTFLLNLFTILVVTVQLSAPSHQCQFSILFVGVIYWRQIHSTKCFFFWNVLFRSFLCHWELLGKYKGHNDSELERDQKWKLSVSMQNSSSSSSISTRCTLSGCMPSK